MRASHPLLVLFLGFAAVVAVRSPGSEAAPSPAKSKSQPIVHQWGAKQRKAQLTCRLVDLTGAGLGGVEVTDARGGAAATTAADGSFTLPVMAGRFTGLFVQRPGRPEHFRVLQGRPLTLLVRPDRPWIGAPAASDSELRGGAGVVCDGPEATSSRVCITVCETGESVAIDGAGNYRIPIPNSTFRILAYDDRGRAALSAECPAPRAEQRWVELPQLTLEPGLAARGTVRDDEGNPVAGAALKVVGFGAVRRLQTDAHGAFEAAGLVSGNYTIEVLPAAGKVGCTEEFVLGAGAPVDLELRLRPEKPLELTVVDEQGAAQAGVFVQVTEVGYTWSLGTTSATGQVQVRGLGGGEYRFEVFAGGDQAYRPLEVVRYDRREAMLVVR